MARHGQEIAQTGPPLPIEVVAMNLDRLQANWDQLGTEDPFWAILSDPRMKGNR